MCRGRGKKNSFITNKFSIFNLGFPFSLMICLRLLVMSAKDRPDKLVIVNYYLSIL